MSQRLADVAEQLRGERESLVHEITSLKEGLAQRESELSRIDGALKALGQKPRPKGARKPGPSTKRRCVSALSSKALTAVAAI